MNVICGRCGGVNDYYTIIAGPHIKAMCNKCKKYIKFLPQGKTQAPEQKPATDQTQFLKPPYMLKLQVIGNLGKDATVNTVNGKSVINFSVAHTEKYKDQQGNPQEKTTWVDCSYWTDKTAVAPYLTKGTQIYAEGTPEVRTFAKQDGTQGASLSVRIYSVQLLGSKQAGDNAATGAQQPQQQAQPNRQTQSSSVNDDLPF